MMRHKNVLHLWWYNKFDNNKINFGDELGVYIIRRIINKNYKVRRVRIKEFNLYYFSRLIVKIVLRRRDEDIEYLLGMLSSEIVLSVGSILSYSTSKCVVWGCGIIRRNETISGGRFVAVRGKYSQKRLLELGFRAPDVVGDPALLLPLVYKNNIIGNKKIIGVIPHIFDYDYVVDAVKNDDEFMIIDFTKDVEPVLEDILKCSFIVSSSLHGIIVSHAYGIPALWCEFSNKLAGDGVKFYDYFSSVDIKEYQPLDFRRVDESLKKNILKEIREVPKDIALPDMEKVRCIQKELLSVAPFKLKEGLFDIKI